MTDNKTIKTVADSYRAMNVGNATELAEAGAMTAKQLTKHSANAAGRFAALPTDHTGNEHTKKAQALTHEADEAWKDPARNWGGEDRHGYHVTGEMAQLKAANAHRTAASGATHPEVKKYHEDMAHHHETLMDHHTNKRFDGEN